jgi:hypothetical protein
MLDYVVAEKGRLELSNPIVIGNRCHDLLGSSEYLTRFPRVLLLVILQK